MDRLRRGGLAMAEFRRTAGLPPPPKNPPPSPKSGSPEFWSRGRASRWSPHQVRSTRRPRTGTLRREMKGAWTIVHRDHQGS
jgi:hypothetical protein